MPGEEGTPLTAVKTGGVSLCVKIIAVVVSVLVVGGVIAGIVVSQTGNTSSSSSSSSPQNDDNQTTTESPNAAPPIITTTANNNVNTSTKDDNDNNTQSSLPLTTPANKPTGANTGKDTTILAATNQSNGEQNTNTATATTNPGGSTPGQKTTQTKTGNDTIGQTATSKSGTYTLRQETATSKTGTNTIGQEITTSKTGSNTIGQETTTAKPGTNTFGYEIKTKLYGQTGRQDGGTDATVSNGPSENATFGQATTTNTGGQSGTGVTVSKEPSENATFGQVTTANTGGQSGTGVTVSNGPSENATFGQATTANTGGQSGTGVTVSNGPSENATFGQATTTNTGGQSGTGVTVSNGPSEYATFGQASTTNTGGQSGTGVTVSENVTFGQPTTSAKVEQNNGTENVTSPGANTTNWPYTNSGGFSTRFALNTGSTSRSAWNFSTTSSSNGPSGNTERTYDATTFVTSTLTTDAVPADTTTPRPTQPPRCFNGYTQTVIFLALDTVTEIGYPFIQGGYVTGIGESCPSACETPYCSADVTHLDDNVTSPHYDAWRTRDSRLDWEGAETDQVTYPLGKGAGTPMPALGTPLLATTIGNPPLNRYGNNYYMVDLCVDCRNATDDWLQLKAVWYNARDLSINHEVNISQPIKCLGNAHGSDRTRPNVESTNHFARCGYVNVFDMNDDSCIIDYIVN